MGWCLQNLPFNYYHHHRLQMNGGGTALLKTRRFLIKNEPDKKRSKLDSIAIKLNVQEHAQIARSISIDQPGMLANSSDEKERTSWLFSSLWQQK